MDQRKGCPCCAFNTFLPNELLSSVDCPSEYSPDTSHAASSFPGPLEATVMLEESIGEKNELVIVDTHGHAQLERQLDPLYTITVNRPAPNANGSNVSRIRLKSISCSVAPSDWQSTLDFCANSKDRLPALGVHPWYLGALTEKDSWLQELEHLLVEHPSALVGEIGLCKMARFVRQHPEGKTVALQLQRDVFQQQLELAARLRRPVSVHCVNQHGVFLSVLKDIVAEGNEPPGVTLPPVIGMHSFTGTAHQVQELLKFEASLCLNRPLFYFGFSHSVNVAMSTKEKAQRKGREAVQAVPKNRLLVESDVHASADLLGGTIGAIAYVASARRESILDVAQSTSRNAIAFVSEVD